MPVDAKQIDPDVMRTAASGVAGLLKVLANPDRLMLLCQLTQGEHCVSQLERKVGVMQPTLSQQLTVLREEQLVTTSTARGATGYDAARRKADFL